MLVKDIMSRRVIYIKPEHSVFDAVLLMNQHNISGLIVGSNMHALGIITLKDIFRKLVAEEKNLKQSAVADYMSTPIQTILYLSTVEAAAQIMTTNKIKRLVVVDSGNNVVGIITSMDLVSKVPKLLHVMFDTWVKPGWK